MIKPKCDSCRKELKEFGGLMFSPPNEKGLVEKFHICKKCWQKVMKNLFK